MKTFDDDSLKKIARAGNLHPSNKVMDILRKVARHERNECAKVCEEWARSHAASNADGCTYETCDFVCAAQDCASKIKARGL